MRTLPASALLLLALGSFACSGAASDEDSTTGDQGVTGTRAQKASDGKYDASFGDKWGHGELHVEVRNGKVTALSGKMSARDGKTSVGTDSEEAEGSFSADVTSVDYDAANGVVVLSTAGTIDPFSTTTWHMENEDSEPRVSAQCQARLEFDSIRIEVKDSERTVTLKHLTSRDDTCLDDAAMFDTDATASWAVAGDATGASAEDGMQKLFDALRTIGKR